MSGARVDWIASCIAARAMAALFPRWSNSAFRLLLMLLPLLGVALLIGPIVYVRTPYNTAQRVAVTQPVEFDHRHHVRDDGIPCLYCHASAERSASAGMPATEVCMGCHNQVWNDSPQLAPLRRSQQSGRPIVWRRVHRLADFVYFNHAVHVRGGIGCERCHGRVDRMASVYKVASLTMGFCLDCHRQEQGHRELTRLTTCTACHR